MSVQGTLSAVDRSIRSVFVGNIPYEATEEQLKDIFSEVGPVVSFRLVYDRETGKPKGYGFCEYKDQETALSAMRNLNGYELNGRALRVDNAASEKNKEELKNLQASLGGPPIESPYGNTIEPDQAPEAISKAVASLPPEQMFELMKQMKLCIETNPNEARNMLLQNPQLAYALLQAQVVMRIVDPQVAMAMLHRANHNVQPLMPLTTSESTLPVSTPAVNSTVMLLNAPAALNLNNQGLLPATQNSTFTNAFADSVAQAANRNIRPALLGERPVVPEVPAVTRPAAAPSIQNQFADPRARDFDIRETRGLTSTGPVAERDVRGLNVGAGASLPGIGSRDPRDSRDIPRDPRDARENIIPPTRDPRSAAEPDIRTGFDPRFRGDPRTTRAPEFEQRNIGGFGDRPSYDQNPMFERDPRGGPPPGPTGNIIRPSNPAISRPQAVSVPVSAPALNRPPVPNQAALNAQDQEKAALIMQVLQLSDQQIAMLPAEQRQSIMVLKEQIARSTGQT